MGHQAEDGELEHAAPRALSSQAVAIQPFMRNTLSHSFRGNGTAGAGDALGSTPFSMTFLTFCGWGAAVKTAGLCASCLTFPSHLIDQRLLQVLLINR